MQANQGKVEVQAQNDELQLNALKDATLTSSAGKVTIAAKEEILITCKGAYIKLSNGEVEIGSPKVVRVRAPLVVSGAESLSIPALPLFKMTGTYKLQYQLTDDNNLPHANKKYTVYLSDYQKLEGVTDENGMTQVFYSEKAVVAKIHLHFEDANHGK